MNSLKENKKGVFKLFSYPIMFFVSLFLFVIVVGGYDFLLVEFYGAGHTILNDSLTDRGINSSNANYVAFEENYDNVNNRNLPFNYIAMYIFLYSIIASFISVVNMPKTTINYLIFKTLGGTLLLLFFAQFVLFEFFDYINDNIIDVIFVDLIINYVPFYLTIMANAYWILFIWALALIMVNRFLGQEGVNS